MQIVELFGPPGVGKTAIARRLDHRLSGLYGNPYGVPVGLYKEAYQVLKDHVTNRLKSRMVRTGAMLACIERIVASQRSGPWLLEEGSAQRANMMALIAVPVSTRQAYVEALPVAHLTVCLCLAGPETIVARGLSRGRPGLPPHHAPISIEACTWTADLLERRGATVHRFDMERPVAENAKRLREILHAA